MREVADDRADLGLAEGSSADFRTHRFQAFRRRGGPHGQQRPDRFREAPEGRFGEADLVRSRQRVVVRDQQRRQQSLAAVTKLDAAEAAEELRAQCLGVPGNDDDVLTAGVEADAADLQLGVRKVGMHGRAGGRELDPYA